MEKVWKPRNSEHQRCIVKQKKNCVGLVIQKWRGMLTSGVVFFHDNTHPHTAACTRPLLEHFNWELFDHPPYSPLLPLSD
jgi:hypothetical protein